MPSLRTNPRRASRLSAHKRRVLELSDDDLELTDEQDELTFDATPATATLTSTNAHRRAPTKAPPSLISTDTESEELISSFVPRSSHTRKKASGDTPRPPNAFICFRMDLCDQSRRLQAEQKEQEDIEGPKAEDDDAKKQQRKKKQDEREISRMAGHIWQSMSDDQRAIYHILQNALKERHAKEFPEYKYSPVHNRCASTKTKKIKVDEARVVRWKMLVQYTIRNKGAYAAEDSKPSGISSILASALRSAPISRRPKSHHSRQQQRRKSSAAKVREAREVRRLPEPSPEPENEPLQEHVDPSSPPEVEQIQVPSLEQLFSPVYAMEDVVTTPEFSCSDSPQLMMPPDSLLTSFKPHAWSYAAELSFLPIDQYRTHRPSSALQSLMHRQSLTFSAVSSMDLPAGYFGHGSYPLVGSIESVFGLPEEAHDYSRESETPLSEMTFTQWSAYIGCN